MEALGEGEIGFRVYGPDQNKEEVSASVFSSQLGTLVRALKAADKAANGDRVHDYVITKLHSSIPTAILAERTLPKFHEPVIVAHSGIVGFEKCVDAIAIGERERALSYGPCAKYVSKFSKSGFSEVWFRGDHIVRVDSSLRDQARTIVDPRAVSKQPITLASRNWYKGIAHGSFDGEIKAVDLRGERPKLKIILSAGGMQIDCICRRDDIEQIRVTLNHRVRVFGRAIYDGKSGLPRRIEVQKIIPVTGSADFTPWKGSFEPFEIEPWEDHG